MHKMKAQNDAGPLTMSHPPHLLNLREEDKLNFKPEKCPINQGGG